MGWTAANPVVIGSATKKSDYDKVYDNADYLKDYVKGDNAEGSGATGHDHDGTDSLLIRVSATDKVLGRLTAGAGTVEEIACTAAGRALLDDASADAQLTTLGVTAAGKALLDDASAAAQRATLGGVALIATGTYTGDDSANKAIAHGLGIVPKIIFVYADLGLNACSIMGATPVIINSMAGSYFTVTAATSTNFYVGNVGNYPESANSNGVGYTWVALA